MNATVAALLVQDGLTSGLIYALLAVSIVLVFLVTRVLWVPAGDIVAFGALTMSLLRQGQQPGTIWLLAALGLLATVIEAVRCHRSGEWAGFGRVLPLTVGAPVLGIVLVRWVVPADASVAVHALLTAVLVAPRAPLLYLTAFRPLTEATVLVKLIAAVALHYLLVGFGLFFFGAEGLRTPPFVSGRIDIGFTTVSWHLVLALVASLVLIVVLWAFFERTLWGKALRATAVNRFGARLVGIRSERAGLLAFGIAGCIGALSGLLIGPIATIYYDSGFLIGLKAFIGVVCAAMASFPIAVAGALAVGVFESFASFFASALKEAIVFALLVPILLWRSLTDHSLHGEEE
ncbi:MAG: branched-chain amino acid ABC transporter permease [Burkholderiales bacterium]